MYTLGILSEVENIAEQPLHEVFDLIYGTSTGSIIGSMLALGEAVETIRDRYFRIVPDVMGRRLPRSRSAALERWAKHFYGGRGFDAFHTNTGIVATHLEYNRPMVFRNYADRAHGRGESFQPGFDCPIGDAVVASCAAFPVFAQKTLPWSGSGVRTMTDGGFSANNPSLFALTDAIGSLGIRRDEIRLLSLGTGSFRERDRLLSGIITTATPVFSTLLKTSSNTVEMLRKQLFPDVMTVRVNDVSAKKRLKTDFMDYDIDKLKVVCDAGREAYAAQEDEIRTLLEDGS